MTRLSRTIGVCPIDRELSSYQCGIAVSRVTEIVETFCVSLLIYNIQLELRTASYLCDRLLRGCFRAPAKEPSAMITTPTNAKAAHH